MDVVNVAQLSGWTLDKVVVHPLVLLVIENHYNRVARDTQRVVGVLLGTSGNGVVDVTNSYAVPFDEDEKDPRIWFLDNNYHYSMFSMFKRINAKEHVVGWYSTGPKLKKKHLDVHALFTTGSSCHPPRKSRSPTAPQHPPQWGVISPPNQQAPPLPQMLGQLQPPQSATYGQARSDSPSTSPLALPPIPGSRKIVWGRLATWWCGREQY